MNRSQKSWTLKLIALNDVVISFNDQIKVKIAKMNSK